jgi:hypothetical protein
MKVTRDQIVDRFEKESLSLSSQDRKNLLRELLQEAILCHMIEVGLFKEMAFHGGTSLRLLHRLNRFSEDLDMSLISADRSFDLPKRMGQLEKSLVSAGINFEFNNRCKTDSAIKAFFINDVSFYVQFSEYFQDVIPGQKLKVKFELDVLPPAYQEFETVEIKSVFSGKVLAHNLSTCMGQKIHAILCRGATSTAGAFSKGRDFYDLEWYLQQGIIPNYKNLSGCLHRLGPWANQGLEIDAAWVKTELSIAMRTRNFKDILADVETFIDVREMKRIKASWSAEHFNRLLSREAPGIKKSHGDSY